MSGYYFQKTPWEDFIYEDRTYSLSHLNEHVVVVIDSQKIERKIAITYEDHCFTTSPQTEEDPALFYPQCSRGIGYFSLDRYHHSLSLPTSIASLVNNHIWSVQGKNYAFLPTVTHTGLNVFYVIVFSLDRVSGLPVDLHMRIATAYPNIMNDIVTYGSVRFAHLVTLRLQHKYPSRITDTGRKRPRLQ